MVKSINDMIGAVIFDFVEIHDYKQIVTDKGIINLYNPVRCYLQHGDSMSFMKALKISSNHVITRIVLETNEHLIFEICDKIIVDLSLNTDECLGSEAASIHFDTGETMVVQN